MMKTTNITENILRGEYWEQQFIEVAYSPTATYKHCAELVKIAIIDNAKVPVEGITEIFFSDFIVTFITGESKIVYTSDTLFPTDQIHRTLKLTFSNDY